MTMNDRRRILACGSLALVWASGCSDPCVDDGLLQEGQADCPGISADDTDGPDPSSSTTNDTVDETAGGGCDNGIQDGDETDVDCGGSCQDNCGNGQGCGGNEDCQSDQCGTDMTCEEPPSCTDGILDGDETDVDCGGSCPGCNDGEMCQEGPDCLSNVCDEGICNPPTCTDGEVNGSETDVDCGGPDCDPCDNGQMCTMGDDCQSTMCDDGTCVGPSCRDGVLNGEETDVDCGGPECDPCDDGETCEMDSDCISEICNTKMNVCIAPTCTDGVQNGDETDVDCGGACGATCDPGEGCIVGMDCLSFGCDGNVCNDYLAVVAAPSCSNFEGAPVGLAATATGGSGVYTYAWTPDDGSLTAPDQAMTDASPTGFQSYTITVDDGFTTAQDSVVVVNSQPFDLQNNCTLYTADFDVSLSGLPASITYDMGGTRGCETGNNEFGLHLCDGVVFQNTRLRGVLEVTNDPADDDDWMGLIWGAQDASHFYSLAWKRQTQNGFACPTPVGIIVRRVEGPDFASLEIDDYYCLPDTANSTLLLDPAATTQQGWVEGESYTVTIDFLDTGSTVTVVRDSDLVEITNFVVTDTTFTSGFFGSTTASQEGACVGPLFAECL
jgi:hypothetical protein